MNTNNKDEDKERYQSVGHVCNISPLFIFTYLSVNNKDMSLSVLLAHSDE